jgi:hypothetical protein
LGEWILRRFPVALAIALTAAQALTGTAWAFSDENPLDQSRNASALYDDGKFHGSSSPGCRTLSFGNNSFSFSMHATQNNFGNFPPPNANDGNNFPSRFQARPFAGTDSGSPNFPPAGPSGTPQSFAGC